MTFRKLAVSTVALGVFVVARPAAAQTPVTTGVVVEEEAQARGSFSGMAQTGFNLGQGTFVEHEFSDSPFFGQSLGVSGMYALGDVVPGGLTLLGTQAFSYEYTDPENATGRSLDYGDTMLMASTGTLFLEPTTGIALGADAGVFLPISYVSRWQDKILSATGAVRLSRAFGKLTTGVRFGAGKNFYEAKTLTISQEDFGDTNQDSVACDGECVGFSRGGYLVNWTFQAGANVGYAFTDKLSAGLAFGWMGGLRFATPDDRYTSENAVAGSTGIADVLNFGLSAAYAIDERFSLSGGFNTNAPLRSSRNTLQVKFYDVENPANNYSGFFIGAAANL